MINSIKVNYPLESIDAWKNDPTRHLVAPVLIRLVNSIMPIYLQAELFEPRHPVTRMSLPFAIEKAMHNDFLDCQISNVQVACDSSNNPSGNFDNPICLNVQVRIDQNLYEVNIK